MYIPRALLESKVAQELPPSTSAGRSKSPSIPAGDTVSYESSRASYTQEEIINHHPQLSREEAYVLSFHIKKARLSQAAKDFVRVQNAPSSDTPCGLMTEIDDAKKIGCSAGGFATRIMRSKLATAKDINEASNTQKVLNDLIAEYAHKREDALANYYLQQMRTTRIYLKNEHGAKIPKQNPSSYTQIQVEKLHRLAAHVENSPTATKAQRREARSLAINPSIREKVVRYFRSADAHETL